MLIYGKTYYVEFDKLTKNAYGKIKSQENNEIFEGGWLSYIYLG